MIEAIIRTASEVDVTPSTPSPPIAVPNGKDEGPQPVNNPVLAPPIVATDSRRFYHPSYATMPAFIPYYYPYRNVTYATLIPRAPGLLPGGVTDSLTRNLPSTIAPELLQPALYNFSPPKQNDDETPADVNKRYSAAVKGKGKVLHKYPEPELGGPLPEDHPYLNLSSNEEWAKHTRPVLQDYANRQIALPLGQRVNISLNEPSQFIQGALQLLANRDHPQNTPVEPSRQLGPQLLENFMDVHRWATEYFRSRFAMPTVGSDVPVLLTIITNTFYEAHSQLIDNIVCAALDRMRARGATTLDIEDFAFGYDFKISHDLPFAAESSSRIHDTLERHRPRSPLNIPVNISTTTRSGRQIKLSKQAQAAEKAEIEKQVQSRQRKKEKEKKMQESASTQAMTPDPLTADVATVHTASATVYHSANHVSLSDTEENVDVLAGPKCLTCGRVMPPGVLTSPANPPLVSQSQSVSGPITSSSRRRNTRPAVSSNLRLAPLTAPFSPLGVPLPTRPAPPPPVPISDNVTHANTASSEGAPRAAALPIPTSSAEILAGNMRSPPALEVTTGTSTHQDLAETQTTPVRGARGGRRARGARARGGRGSRGRGRGGAAAAAPLTITIPARSLPAVSASTGDPTATAATKVTAITDAVRYESSGAGTANATDPGPVTTVHPEPSGAFGDVTIRTTDSGPTTTASTETHVVPGTVQSESASTTATSTGNTTVTAHYPQRCSTQTATTNTTANIPGQYGKISYEAMAAAADANYPGYHSSTATITVDTAAGPSVNKSSPVEFSDPGQLITHVLSAGALPGVGVEVSGSVGCSTVTTTDSGIDVTLASVSHVNGRRSKKRKLDDSE